MLFRAIKIILFYLTISYYSSHLLANEVVVSIGFDAYSSLIKNNILRPKMIENNEQIATLKIKEQYLNLLSSFLHNNFNRCGGYILEDEITPIKKYFR